MVVLSHALIFALLTRTGRLPPDAATFIGLSRRFVPKPVGVLRRRYKRATRIKLRTDQNDISCYR